MPKSVKVSKKAPPPPVEEENVDMEEEVTDEDEHGVGEVDEYSNSDDEDVDEMDGDDDDDDDDDDDEDNDGDDDDDDDDDEEEEGDAEDATDEEFGVATMDQVADPTSIRERIDNALETLSDFKSRKNKSKSRSEIIQGLSKDLSEYYGYIQELSDFLLELFSPEECVEYMDASDRPRPLVIRTNTLKTTRKDLLEALGKRGCVVEGIDWSKVAIKVTESSVPIGATPEYLSGQYMLQSAASMNPVMALAAQPGERVLDMSAAPGGKTSFICQMMKNSGTVVANDLKAQRQKATVANLHRMGVKNAITCCYDGRKIPHVMKGFDRVLLDAPCSGLGVIARDQTVKLQRTVKDIQRIAHLQKELLCAAIDAVDPRSSTGSIIVYSTCSISSEENEQVVDYVLKRRHVKLVETGLEVGKPGLTRHKERRFHPSLTLTRRFYPHVHNMDGFYVAKFKKFENGVKMVANDDDDDDEEEEEEEEEEVEDDEGDAKEYDDDDHVLSSADGVKAAKEDKQPVGKGSKRKVDNIAAEKPSKTKAEEAPKGTGSEDSNSKSKSKKPESKGSKAVDEPVEIASKQKKAKSVKGQKVEAESIVTEEVSPQKISLRSGKKVVSAGPTAAFDELEAQKLHKEFLAAAAQNDGDDVDDGADGNYDAFGGCGVDCEDECEDMPVRPKKKRRSLSAIRAQNSLKKKQK
jgi:ribosomal RNA methyltransferase Nop2